MPGVGSASDPYVMPEFSSAGVPAGNSSYGGKTQVDILPVAAGTAVIVLFGDSLAANSVNSIFTPTQSQNHNFDVYNGAAYATTEPLLGCTSTVTAPTTSGSFFSRVADSLITNAVYSRTILVPIACGGATFADWAVGGALNGRFRVAAARLATAGLTPTAVYSMLGANDKNAGTSEASATASLNSIIATIRTYWSCNIFIAKQSNFGLGTSAAVQNAEAAVLSVPGQVYSGGDMDSLAVSAGNYWDNTHFNATGAAAAAALAATAISAHP